MSRERGMTTNGNYLNEIIAAQKRGESRGIYSICSYSRYAIESAVQLALEDEGVVLVESTCNQVNQFGGYTGMTPSSFRDYVTDIADSMGLPLDRVVLGGDHLGPFPFKEEASEVAMAKAREMVRQYALSGCTKIHLDTSMRLADDPGDASTPLDPHVIADRCAELCGAAEAVHSEREPGNGRSTAPLFVIGTEVPPPGGSDEADEELPITSATDLKETIRVTREAFSRHGLQDAWKRVVAVVVEPGVGHGDHTVVDYDREKATHLASVIADFPELVLEGHTTDYQRPRALKEMVEDGIAILKVGPALTYAARETIFMLERMEEELLGDDPAVELSRFSDTLDDAMVQHPRHWRAYYHGTARDVQFARKYSLFDRARYYLTEESVDASLDRLLANLRSTDIPLPLISQFLPCQHAKLREGSLAKDPEVFIRDRIMEILRAYSYAVGNREQWS
jgi:D-tagatose-1,6-bisphosphate aldolase subunit GatZ/KbaZ